MARKDFPDSKFSELDKKILDDIPMGPLPGGGGGLKAKASSALNRSLEVLKFVLGVCLLPFVYSYTVSYLNQLELVGFLARQYFWIGVVTFLVVYLFVWEPTVVYAKGQKVLEAIFTLFKPLVKVAPFVLPIYAILIFVVYWMVSFIATGTLKYFLFLFGFFLALHLAFSAKTLRSRKGGFLKGHYIFSFSFVYILNVFTAALCFSVLFEHYSFLAFFTDSFQIARGIYSAVFHQLFVVQG